jgi:hypothetical protein
MGVTYKYTGPIPVDHSLTLKFISVDSEGNVSAMQEESYVIIPPVIADIGQALCTGTSAYITGQQHTRCLVTSSQCICSINALRSVVKCTASVGVTTATGAIQPLTSIAVQIPVAYPVVMPSCISQGSSVVLTSTYAQCYKGTVTLATGAGTSYCLVAAQAGMAHATMPYVTGNCEVAGLTATSAVMAQGALYNATASGASRVLVAKQTGVEHAIMPIVISAGDVAPLTVTEGISVVADIPTVTATGIIHPLVSVTNQQISAGRIRDANNNYIYTYFWTGSTLQPYQPYTL